MIWAWLGATAVGLTMGLLGSGGAILTVPILVYLVRHDEKTAIVESLAIVGAIAVAGVIRASTQRRVDFRNAALLAVPGIAGTLGGAYAAKLLSGAVQLVVLAVLMLTASALMMRSSGATNGAASGDVAVNRPRWHASLWMIAAQGVGLGFVTGLVGVGGGFLIVPVLVLLRGLPMPVAVGTSLAIIAVNSISGLIMHTAVDGDAALHLDWPTIGVFIALGVVGSLAGNALAGRIPQRTLKQVFAVFLVVMAGYILVRQAPRVLPGVFGPTSATPESHLEP